MYVPGYQRQEIVSPNDELPGTAPLAQGGGEGVTKGQTSADKSSGKVMESGVESDEGNMETEEVSVLAESSKELNDKGVAKQLNSPPVLTTVTHVGRNITPSTQNTATVVDSP